MPAVRPVLFAAALLYLALPGHPLAILPGLPLGPLGVAVALAVGAWWIGLPGAPPRARVLLGAVAALVVVKVITSELAPPYGLVAEYRVDGAPNVEQSTEWRRADWTRIDHALRFAGDELPVHFFNDVRRFNYFRANEPGRDLLPFAVRWVGQFRAPEAGRYTFTVDANGPAALSVAGGRAAIEQAGRVRSASFEVDLEAGLHPLEASYRRSDEAMPWLSVDARRSGGLPETLAAPALVQPGTSIDAVRRDSLLAPLARGIDVALLALLTLAFAVHALAAWRGSRAMLIPSPVGGDGAASPSQHGPADCSRSGSGSPDGRPPWSMSERALLALYFLAASMLALVGHLHLHGRAVILSGGNDWLAYESFARDVLLGGPLLTEGRPLGQGVPYYYQPLYVYWLALVHLVAGEGLFGPLLANTLLGIVAGLGVYALGRELFGRLAGAAALLLFELCRVTFFAPTAGLLLSENLLIPQIPLLLLLLVRALRTAGWRWLALSGVALGLAGLTRTTPLALLPPALLILVVPFKRRGLPWAGIAGRLGLVVAACVLTVSLATVRNYVVSGRPVPITSSAGANLWEAHRPTARVDLSRIDRDPLYERLGLDRQTREVVEFARQDPAGYVATLVPMFLYAVGVVGAVSNTWEVHYGLAGICAAYALTTVLVRRARAWPVCFVHAFVLSHLAQMTVFFSHQYGYRLILPMYVAMAPVVGLGVAAMLQGLVRAVPRGGAAPLPASGMAPRPRLRTAGVVGLLASGVAVVAVGAPRDPTPRESFYGLNGDAALAASQALIPDYLRLADMVYFAGDDSRSTDVAYLRGLAFPAMRWFDGARGMVLPPADQQALYVLPHRAAADVARRCVGGGLDPTATMDPRTDVPAVVALLDASRSGACVESRQPIGATFEGTARVLGLDAPSTIEPGQPMDVTLRWEPLARPQNRVRPFVRLVDSKGRRWGQPAEANVYPSSSWRPGELVVGVTRLDVDPTLPPGEYGLEVGIAGGAGAVRLAESGPWGQQGQPEALGGSVRLVSRSTPLSPDALPLESVRDERLDGVRFLGAALDREAPKPGERVRLSLFWQSAAARLPEHEVSLILRDGRSVLHEWRGVPVDGTYPTTRWKPSEVVRDTWDLTVPATLPGGPLELAVGLAAPTERPERYVGLSTFAVQPVARLMDEPSVRTRQEARFGDVARLVGFDLRNRRVRPGDTADLTLVWQCLAETRDNYAVTLYVLGEDDRVLAQLEEEPAGGKRPTAGWTVGEYVEDGHRLRVPRDAPRGRLKLAVGLVDEDGRRLLDGTGAERVVLQTELVTE